MPQDKPSLGAYAAAAWLLMAEVRAMRAVAEVESGPEGAFLDSGEPVILFERHLFSRFTSRKYDEQRISGNDWGVISARTPGGYGSISVQHVKLGAAAQLDRDAALRACSWGLFQILGDNHVACGYPSLQRFITAMYRSVDDHLRAFVMFIRNDSRLVDALREKNWPLFARIYNGPATQGYGARIAAAYERLGQE